MIVLQFNNKTLKLHEDDSSYRYRALMEKPTLTLKFSMPEFIEIPVGAWCEYQGEIYTLNKPENFKKQGSRRLEYTLTLGDPSELLGEYKVRNNVDRRLKWSMCAKPREFVQIIVENLNQRAGGGWSVGECIDATEKTIEFNHTYCDAALQSVSEVFNTEWEIIGKVFHLRKVEYFKDDPLPLGYGKGNGFKPGVGRSTESGQKPVKRLYVQGGSRNIDRSKYGAPDLLLPKSQTLEYEGRVYKADDDGYFIERYDKISSARKEDSLDCSEIYPSRVGEVTSVVTVDAAKNWYDFVDNTIPANLNFNDYLIEGETATIVFQSGMLAGDDKQFEFKYDHEKRRFEIKPQEIDGVTMPNASYKPQAGDRYAVFGIMLPNEYIRNDADKSGASWDMFREAARYLYENEDPKFTFSGELQSLYTKKNWLRIGGRLKIGSYILFTDEQFAPDGVPIRIVGIKENLSSPYAPIITISNESHGTNITSKLNEISQNEVKIEESHNDAIRFTKRRFRDATETMSMLEDALLDNFTNSINPIAVRTMQILVGDESLQFRFIQSRTSQTSVNLNITYNDETKRLNCPHGFLQHLTLGINTLAPSHKPNEYLVWEMNAYQSPQLTDGAKQYYLYARVHRTNTALVGSFLLSPTAIGMKQEANYYHLLVGVLNSEYDGERSFATLYGFTEILPGRVTTDKVVSADGNSFFDMLGNAFKLGNKLRFNVDGDNKLVLNGTMVQSESGDEFPVPCYRGVWNARTTYYKGDLVSYNDGKGTSMYICIAPSYCTGRTPGGDGNAYWSLYASHGDNGDFTEYRYAVNGSKTQAPALASSERNPSDWSVGQPTLGTLQYMWCIFAKISGETNSLLSNWSTPVRVTPYDGVDGKPGKDGKSPVLVFCGKYDNTKTYYGNEHRLDAVKYGDTFYIARIDAGTFYGVTPDNDSKWNNFGASFDSVATNLLLADNANIANLIFRNQRLESSATTNGQPNFFIDGLNNIASFANNNIVFDKSSAKLGWINIVERDLIGYDDNGIERLRITPDPLPDINSYSTKKISITVAGGYDNADVTIGQGDMIMGSGLVHQDFDLNGSLISEDATLSCWAEFYVPASSTLQLLNFEASCPNAKTISGKNITPEISATASLQYKDGNSIGNIDLNSPTPHIDIPNAGTVRLNLSVRCNYVEGISWNGSASIGIQGMSINDTANHIVEARDGIMAIYNGNYLRMHSTEGFSVKIGSTRFRINDSGIAKSSDGTKWTLI